MLVEIHSFISLLFIEVLLAPGTEDIIEGKNSQGSFSRKPLKVSEGQGQLMK